MDKKEIELKRVNVTYVEQRPQSFYGMYLYNDNYQGNFEKLDRDSANTLLKVLTQNIPEIKDLELPSRLTSSSMEDLDLIKKHLNESQPGIFDWDDIMDVS